MILAMRGVLLWCCKPQAFCENMDWALGDWTGGLDWLPCLCLWLTAVNLLTIQIPPSSLSTLAPSCWHTATTHWENTPPESLPDSGGHQVAGTDVGLEQTGLLLCGVGRYKQYIRDQTPESRQLRSSCDLYGARKSEHVTPLLQTLNWLTVRNRLDLNTACFMYKVEHGMVPETLSNFFIKVSERSLKDTRQSNDFHLPLLRTKPARRSLTYRGPVLWNALPNEIRLRPSLQSFKRALKATPKRFLVRWTRRMEFWPLTFL